MTAVFMLRDLRKKNGVSQQRLADALGVARSTVAMWESKASQPDNHTLQAIADYFTVTTDYLLGRDVGEQQGKAKGVRIPVLGKVQAGIPLEAVQDILDYEEISLEMASYGEYFALSIRGDSMAPRITEGDVVIVRRQNTVENGDTAVVFVNGEDATVKRFYHTEHGIKLVPINPAYEPLFFSPSEAERLPVVVIGKVVELRGKL